MWTNSASIRKDLHELVQGSIAGALLLLLLLLTSSGFQHSACVIKTEWILAAELHRALHYLVCAANRQCMSEQDRCRKGGETEQSHDSSARQEVYIQAHSLNSV